MSRFGLIGRDIAHSLSPVLFEAAYPDLKYDLIDTPDFREAFDRFLTGYDAVNVTAPYKEEAFAAADRRDPEADAVGAANILLKQGGVVVAANSDCGAVRSLLNEVLPEAACRKVLVIGCGGAGKAAATAAAGLGLETAIANRSFEKAEDYCKGSHLMRAMKLEEISDRLDEFGIVIYTLPVMIPAVEVINASGLVKIEAGYKSPFLRGEKLIPGLRWLKAQAAGGYELMTGRIPDRERLESIL